MQDRSSVVDAIAAAVLAVGLVVALLTFRDYGLNWDEPVEAEYGKLLLSFYGSGFSDHSAFSFFNLHYYGGAFDLAGAALDRISPFGHFPTRRLLGALIGIAGLVIVWRMARRLGGPVAGLAALVLLATCPLYYGHMFINPKDAPFAVAMALLLYALVRAFEQHPRPGIGTIALCGVAFGLAVGTRVIGLVGFTFAGIGIAMLAAAEAQTLGIRPAAIRVMRIFARLLLALPVAYVVMAAAWPWSVEAPLNPLRAIQYFSHFWEIPWDDLYDGRLISILAMPRSYVPKLLLLKLPELFSALALAGAAGAIVAALRSSVPPWRRAASATVVTAALLPILMAVTLRPTLYNSVRHFLFVVPPLAVLGGLAAAYLHERLSLWRPSAAWTGAAAFVLLLVPTIVDLVRLHPYQYVSFNRIAAGIGTASHRYMLDYWGLGLNEAAAGLRRRIDEQHLAPPAGRKWKVAVCGPADIVPDVLGSNFDADNDPRGADFALSMGTYYCARLKAPILATAQREGVVFARAYDLRGLSFATTYFDPDKDWKP